jgi:carbon storage regulator
MLILQRKAGESLFIGDTIQVTVVSVDSGGRVRLAIDAPKSLSILRSELRGAMDVNQEAAQEGAAPMELLNFLEGVVGKGDG